MTVSLRHESFGSKDSPPILILHGWGISGSHFRRLAQRLSSDFYVLLPDLPGFGNTPEPEVPYSIDDYAGRVLRFLSEQNIRSCSIIGHSFGGQVAVAMAARHPERVENLILSGASGIESFIWKRSFKRLLYLIASKILKHLTWIPIIQKLKDRVYKHRDVGKVTGIMRETFHNVIRESRVVDAKQLKCPVYLLWGQNDTLTPVADADYINSLIPRSKLKIFAGVGHKLPYERDHQFAQEVRAFLLYGGNTSGFAALKSAG